MRNRKRDGKVESLRRHGSLHPHPERVTDELFVSSEFFDARDLLQVKYEMLRRVRIDRYAVTRSTADFGLSRPTYYEALRAYEERGLSGLLPKRPGPRRAHKLSTEVVAELRKALTDQPQLMPDDLVEWVQKRFGLSVHRRSIERALAREEKKRHL